MPGKGYRGRIRYHGKIVFLGYFPTREEAQTAAQRFCERRGLNPDFRQRIIETKRAKYGPTLQLTPRKRRTQ